MVDVIERWLESHRVAITSAEVSRGGGRVACFLTVARAAPLPDISPETLAAAAVTADYQRDPGRLHELLSTTAAGEVARARAYAGRVLQELCQNVEDAYREQEAHGALHLRAERKGERTWISLAHEGRPFNASDIDAFRRMYGSTKTDGSGRIGHFGVGIKAILSVADALDLHSGGFHLRFEERDPEIPFFLLPEALPCPTQPTPAVYMRLRWRDTSAPDVALAELLSGFVPEHLLFLDRLHTLVIHDVDTGLGPPRHVGPFRVHDVLGSQGEERWVFGDAEAAVAVRICQEASGPVLRPPGSCPPLAAYFPITKVEGGAGAWLHAPLALSDDRESLALARRQDRDQVADCLERLSGQLAQLGLALVAAGVDVSELPSVLFGSPEQARADLSQPLEGTVSEALARGQRPASLLRHLLAHRLADVAWVPCVGGLRSTTEVLWGDALHDHWVAAFPEDPALPHCIDWLRRGPAAELGVGEADDDDLAERLAPLTGGHRIGDLCAVDADERASSWLRLAVELGLPHGAPLPVPVRGTASDRLLVALDGEHADSEDLTALGFCLVDPGAVASWSDEHRWALQRLLVGMGGTAPNETALLDELDEHRPTDPSPLWDTPALRLGLSMVARLESLPDPSAIWSALFGTSYGWMPLMHHNIRAAVYARRLRAPMSDGCWRPLGHGTVDQFEGVPASHQIDVEAVSALLLNATPDSARQRLLAAGSWSGVPAALHVCLPLRDQESWKRERCRFLNAAPEMPRHLLRFVDGTTPLHGEQPWPDRPDTSLKNRHNWAAPNCGGCRAGYPPVLLAQAHLPEGFSPAALEALASDERWHDIDTVPLWEQHPSKNRRYKAISSVGLFPSLLSLQLRQQLRLPRARPPVGERSQQPQRFAPAASLFRLGRYPRDTWARVAARHLPLVSQEIANQWPAASLDRLHIIDIEATRDPRHLLVLLSRLYTETHTNLPAPGSTAGAALRLAHRDTWEGLARLIGDGKPGQHTLERSVKDAHQLGWLPEGWNTTTALQVLTEHAGALLWRPLGDCHQEQASVCSFYDPDPNDAGRRVHGEHLSFAVLSRNSGALARVLGLPRFKLLPLTWTPGALATDVSGWLGALMAGLRPWLAIVLTEQSAGGGVPMKAETFEERARWFDALEVVGLSSWPGLQAVADPPGGSVPLTAEDPAPFRLELATGGRRATLLVHTGRVPDLAHAHAQRWRLAQPLAEALGSSGHAPHVQNLLRALDPDLVAELENDPGLLELVGHAPSLELAPEPPLPAADGDLQQELARLFRHVRARAAAIALFSEDEDSAVSEAELPWAATATWRALISGSGPDIPSRLRDVLRVHVSEPVTASAIADALSRAVGDDTLVARLELLLRRQSRRHTWRGEVFDSLAQLEPTLAEEVEELPLPKAGSALSRSASDPTGAGAAGGGRFSGRASLTGRLGELYARRWCAHHLAEGNLSRVIDVSTPAARAAALSSGALPQNTGPAQVSPGVDLLVLREGELPLGVEVKSRRGHGPIAFEWTRNEQYRCRQTVKGGTQNWALGDYKVLVVSRLDPEAGTSPTVVLIDAPTLLTSASPRRWVVRVDTPPLK